MGYLLADLIRQALGAEVGLVAATSVRGNLLPDPIRVLDIYRIYGRAYRVAVVRLKGEVLKTMFEAGLDRVDAFFYPSGVEILYDLDRPKGDQIVDINLEGGKPLALDKTYPVAIGKEADAFKTYQAERSGDLIRDLLGRYIQEQGTIRGQVDSRYRPASKVQDGVE